MYSGVFWSAVTLRYFCLTCTVVHMHACKREVTRSVNMFRVQQKITISASQNQVLSHLLAFDRTSTHAHRVVSENSSLLLSLLTYWVINYALRRFRTAISNSISDDDLELSCCYPWGCGDFLIIAGMWWGQEEVGGGKRNSKMEACMRFD